MATPSTELSYLGTSLHYPIKLKNGAGVIVGGTDNVNQSIVQILGTPVGTRLMLPEFGSRLYQLLFEPNDAILRAFLIRFIRQALALWEKRIAVIDVKLTSEGKRIDCEINYLVLASNEVNSFIYPFYTELIN